MSIQADEDSSLGNPPCRLPRHLRKTSSGPPLGRPPLPKGQQPNEPWTSPWLAHSSQTLYIQSAAQTADGLHKFPVHANKHIITQLQIRRACVASRCHCPKIDLSHLRKIFPVPSLSKRTALAALALWFLFHSLKKGRSFRSFFCLSFSHRCGQLPLSVWLFFTLSRGRWSLPLQRSHNSLMWLLSLSQKGQLRRISLQRLYMLYIYIYTHI